jgi:outer membrane protein TolC
MRTHTGSFRIAAAAAVVCCCLGGERVFAQQEGAPVDAPPAPVRWSLGDVIATAIAKHPLVGQADAGVRAAAARREQVASVRLPQVDATAGASWAEARAGASGDYDTFTATTVKGTLAQLVTDFGRTGATLARAEDLTAASEQNARSARVDVVFAAAVAYFNVLRAENLKTVRRETVRQREALQRQAQAFFDAGLKARIDVVRAEANLYQARADAASVEHEVRTARLILLNRMGIDGPIDFELTGAPGVAEAAGTVEDWQREADEKHPYLVALRMQLAAARNNRLAANRGNNPSITASGSLGWSGTDDLPSDRAWSVGAQLTVPVFDGFLTREQVAEADAQLVAAEFALNDRRREIRLLVEQAANSMQDAVEQLAASEKSREAFAENLRLATGRYEAGAADIIEMIDAQVQMTTAETTLVRARFDQATALASLYRALGRLPQSGP